MVAADAAKYARIWAAVHSNLAGLVVLVGVLSVVQDSWLGSLPHRGNLHALFGVLLWLCVVERFYARLRFGPRLPLADIRPLARRLTRWVYLLLYVLILVRLVIDLCAAPRHAMHAAADFQSYLACGVVAIATIHALAALCHHLAMYGAHAPLNLVQRNGRLT